MKISDLFQNKKNNNITESLNLLSQWKNDEPVAYVKQLTKFFKAPDELTHKRAVWYNKDGFKRIEVLDEFILHASPVPHYDYVYSYVDIKVPHDLSDDLAKSSESILIDHLKNEVGARCASLSANAVTIQYVIDVVEGNIKPSKAEYVKRIKSMKKMFADGKRFELDWWPDITGDTDPKNKYYKESKNNNIKSSVLEAKNLGLTIFDIDDTLFRTTAQIKVVKDGKIIKSLNNQEFNIYKLQPGESFDFGEFQNAEKFNRESIPIEPMIAKLKAIINNAGDSKVIMLTARSDFDNKELFLDTFRKYGIDMNRVHVHRAGNLGGSPSQNKAVWIRKYLDTGDYARVRLYDDAMSNIKMFISLQQEYPNVKFFPYFVTHEGSIKTIREDGRIVNNVIDNKNGWGAVPNNQEVDYLGLRVMMSPKTFIDLAAPLDGEPSNEIFKHIQNGGKIGSPFLRIEIPESWTDGDLLMPARVVGHEGRNRMLAIEKVIGNAPIEVHLFFSQGLRNRHITDDMKKMLNKGLVKEKSKSIVRGPLFSLTESIREDGRIVKGVNTTVDVGPNEIKTQAAKFGNTVDKDGRPPTLSKKVKGSTTNVLFNLGLAESGEPRYTAKEWATMEGGHSLEEPEVKIKPFDFDKY
jgi:hypothetical protein